MNITSDEFNELQTQMMIRDKSMEVWAELNNLYSLINGKGSRELKKEILKAQEIAWKINKDSINKLQCMLGLGK